MTARISSVISDSSVTVLSTSLLETTQLGDLVTGEDDYTITSTSD